MHNLQGTTTMARLTEDQISFLSKGLAHQIGSVTADGRPCLVRGLGADLCDDGRVMVLLSAESGFEVLDAIRATGKVALNLTSPANYQSLSLKGVDAVVEHAGAPYRALLLDRQEGFRTNLIPLGFPLEYTDSMYSVPDEQLVMVRFTPMLAWNQTPGPGAGKPVALQE
ncbi:MAG: hypothetical protein QM776_06460 [Rhodocyclaceae bacterium]